MNICGSLYKVGSERDEHLSNSGYILRIELTRFLDDLCVKSEFLDRATGGMEVPLTAMGVT